MSAEYTVLEWKIGADGIGYWIRWYVRDGVWLRTIADPQPARPVL